MVNERVQKSSSWTPQPHAKSSFSSPPVPTPAKAPTPQDIENQAFMENKHEALGLQLQAKYGTITPQGQERLTVLQAKMDTFRRDRLESIPSTCLLDIPNLFAPRETPQPIQPKLKIGQVGDKQEADRVAAKVVSQINAPQTQPSAQGEVLQREEMPKNEGELQMQPEATIIQRRDKTGKKYTKAQLERLRTLAKDVARNIQAKGRSEIDEFLRNPIAYFNRSEDPLQKGTAVEAVGLTEVLRYAQDCTVLTNVELLLVDNANNPLSDGSVAELDFLILGDASVKEIISAKFKPDTYKPERDKQMLNHFYAMQNMNMQQIEEYAYKSFGSKKRGTPKWFKNIAHALVRFNDGSEFKEMLLSDFGTKYLSKTPVDQVVVKGLSPAPEPGNTSRLDLTLAVNSSELRDKLIELVKKELGI